MKKILFIHHAAGWGGAPINMINIINNLDKSKYKIKVLLLKDSIVKEKLIEKKIEFTIASSVFYKKYYMYFPHSEAGYVKWFEIHKLFFLSIIWCLSRFIFTQLELAKHGDIDIIHLNSSVLTDWLWPSKKKSKVIMHIQEPIRKGRMDFLYYFFQSRINRYADKIIVISKDNARRLSIPEKTIVVYNFAEIFQVSPKEDSYSSKKVLYLGGSSTSKGFYTLVEALDYLDKDVKVYFGGKYIISKKSGNIINILKFYFSKAKTRNAAIQKINNHQNAIVIGQIHNVQYYLEEICCIVSPFLVPHFSRPVMEAHLHRKAAIGSDVEGMSEIIEHEKNGLIVPKDNPKALAAAINELTDNCQKAKRFGEDGFSKAKEIYTFKNIHKIEHIYDMLLI